MAFGRRLAFGVLEEPAPYPPPIWSGSGSATAAATFPG